MVVVVDEPRDDGASLQINHPSAGGQLVIADRSDKSEPSILNRELLDDGVFPVHRHDLPVGKPQVAGVRAWVWNAL